MQSCLIFLIIGVRICPIRQNNGYIKNCVPQLLVQISNIAAEVIAECLYNEMLSRTMNRVKVGLNKRNASKRKHYWRIHGIRFAFDHNRNCPIYARYSDCFSCIKVDQMTQKMASLFLYQLLLHAMDTICPKIILSKAPKEFIRV
jgi:hypothetical protein